MTVPRRHALVLAVLALLTILVVLVLGTKGLGYPNPADRRRPVAEIESRSAAERGRSSLVLSLSCLDSLTKAKPNDAIRFCSLALALAPDSVSLLNLRGAAYALAGARTLALADLSHALALDPRDLDAYRVRGNVYVALKRDREALADYDHALSIVPRDPLSLQARGFLYQTQGRYRLAIADFDAAIAVQPRLAPLWNSRCWTRMLANRDLQAALADCDMAVRLQPTSANARDSRGYVLLRLHRPAGAIDSFERALALSPKLASSLFGRGIARLQMRDALGVRDIAMARLIEPGIEQRFARVGIRVPAIGPSGA